MCMGGEGGILWPPRSITCLAFAPFAPLHAGGYDMKVWYSRDPATDEQGYIDWPLVTPNKA